MAKIKKMPSSRTSGKSLDWTLAPESTDHVRISAFWDLFSSGKWHKQMVGVPSLLQ
jgi:hypothetical protein